MDTGLLQRLTSIAAWSGLFALLGLLIGSGAVVLGALIIVTLFAILVVSLAQRLNSAVVWAGLCALFSFFVGSGAIVPGALIVVMLFAVIAVILGPQFIAAGWMIGSPTLFGFPNEILTTLPFVTMERLILLMLTVVVFLQYAFGKRKTSWLPLEFMIVVFLAYALLNMLIHTDAFTYKRDGWLWMQYLLPMGGFIVSRRIQWSDRGLKILLAALTATGVFVAITGILQSSFGVTVFTMDYQPIAPGHVGRAYGTFGNSHTFIATLFIFLGLSLLQYASYRDALLRSMLIVAMVVMIIGIFMGQTRAPWLGAVLAFLIIFVKHPPARPLMIIVGFIAFIAAIVFSVFLIGELDGFIRRVTNFATLQGRLATWAVALNMIADNPVLGLGFGSGTFARNEADYLTGIGALTTQYQYAFSLGVPHNEYLYVAVMLGIPALFLFLWILLRLVKLMFAIFNDKAESDLRRHLALYVGAIIVALMFNSIFSDTYLQEYFWALAFFLAGIAAGNVEQAPRPVRRVEQGGGQIAPGGS